MLEQHTRPGGYATCFQQGAYRFDASLHALAGLAPGGGVDRVLQELGIAGRLRLHRLDPLYLLRLPDRDVVAHADLFRYESELIRHFPEQQTGIRSYLDEVLAVYHQTRRREEDQAAGRVSPLAEFATRYPALARAGGQTWAQLMAQHVPDGRVQAVLGALWFYVGLPPSRCDAIVGAAVTALYLEHGGWYPEGGAQALSDALARVLTERGGQIRYEQLVTSIELEGDHAVAVKTPAGRLEADLIISNASAPVTMLKLIGADRLPADYATRVATPTPSYTTVEVSLGLGSDVFADHGLPHELFVATSYDPDAAWQAALHGDWDRVDMAITDYTHVDPGCAPAGEGVVVLSTIASWDYQNTWGTGGDLTTYRDNPRYLELKNTVADQLIARASQAVPGLAAAIRHRDVATPLTKHRYTLNPRGAIEGYENSPANSGPGWLPQQPPIRNLLLAGAWTNTGGMTTAITSGFTAARLAARTPAPV